MIPFCRFVSLAVLITAGILSIPNWGRAAVPAGTFLDGINVTYHHGSLMQHVKVAPLFYGSSWQDSDVPAYLQAFLKSLFDDRRFMENLAQYSDGGFQISDGSAVAPAVDPADLPATMTDAQLLTEIKAQITSGMLPQPDVDTLYVICTPPGILVRNGKEDSQNSFVGYHAYDAESHFAYAVVALTVASASDIGPLMTVATSHELAEVVTDPEPPHTLTDKSGWYDPNKPDGIEIGDIVLTLFNYGFIDDDDLLDQLTGADGTQYLVQKVWSNRDQAPVAFAPAPEAGTATTAGGKGASPGTP